MSNIRRFEKTIICIIIICNTSCIRNHYVFERYKSHGVNEQILLDFTTNQYILQDYVDNGALMNISYGSFNLFHDTITMQSDEQNEEKYNSIKLNQSNSQKNDTTCFMLYDQYCNNIFYPSLVVKKADSSGDTMCTNSLNGFKVRKQKADSLSVLYYFTQSKYTYFNCLSDTVMIQIFSRSNIYGGAYFLRLNDEKWVFKNRKLAICDTNSGMKFYNSRYGFETEYKKLSGFRKKNAKIQLMKLRDSLYTPCDIIKSCALPLF